VWTLRQVDSRRSTGNPKPVKKIREPRSDNLDGLDVKRDGLEDLGVHVIERLEPEGGVTNPERWREFGALLPRSPLSYDGLIVTVVWRVRVRAVFGKNQEWIGELPFQLGDVDRPREKENPSR
jgi:hypothetical protein